MRHIEVDAERFLEIVRVRGVAAAAEACGISMRTGSRLVRDLRTQGELVEIKRGRPRGSGDPEESAFRRLRRAPFPYPPMLSDEQIRAEYVRLVNAKSFLDGDVIRPRSNIGLPLCYPFFPNRYTAKSRGNISAVDAWHDKNALRRAIRLQIAYGDPTTPERVLRAITLQCRTPTIFRPAVAKFICERFAQPGNLVWDPCAGYGGRLLGAAAAGVQYIGTDVEPETVDGNRRLAQAVGMQVCVELCAAEDFVPPTDVALVFTSPPYFDRERYSDDAAQSWRRHGTIETWLRGFLVPVVERAWRCLRPQGHFVINVADVRSKGVIVPIVAETIRAAVSVGFHHAATLEMPIAGINRKNPSEPVLVFQK
jgi:SAM-dependent methyltransferase